MATLTCSFPRTIRAKPYELSIDRRPAVKFEAGLMPVKLGMPREHVYPVTVVVAGDGPKITISNLNRPRNFRIPKNGPLYPGADESVPCECECGTRRIAEALSWRGGAALAVDIYAAALPHE